MPAAFSQWRRAPRTRRSIGSSRSGAASFRSTGFTCPDRLARTVRSDRFTVVVDRDFDAVIDGCAQPMPGRTRTWINGRIRNLYRKLYERGDCHTVEVYEGDAAGRRPLRRQPRTRIFRRKHVPPLPRRLQGGAWCIWWRGSRPAITACSIRNSSPGICARSAPSRFRGRPTTSCSMRRSWPAKLISARFHLIAQFRAARCFLHCGGLRIKPSAVANVP